VACTGQVIQIDVLQNAAFKKVLKFHSKLHVMVRWIILFSQTGFSKNEDNKIDGHVRLKIIYCSIADKA
jgi:hypothetical protein